MFGIPIEILVGPVAAVVVLLLIGRELWAVHKEADADVRKERDVARSVGEAQVVATTRIADELAAERREREKLEAELVRLAWRAGS